jgi:hypothetical protein
MFLYAPLPYNEGAKQNTIKVTRGASVSLPHHKGFALIYPMENETSFLPHVIER